MDINIRFNRELFPIVAEGLLSRISFGIVGFALPLYGLHLGLSMGLIGLLASLHFIVEMLFKPFLSSKADKIGLKKSVAIALITRSIVALLLACSGAVWHIFAIRAIHGLSEALREPSINALIAQAGGKKRIASAFGWYNTVRVVAGSLGKALAGILITYSGYNYFLVFSVAFVIALLGVFVVVPNIQVSESSDICENNEPKSGTDDMSEFEDNPSSTKPDISILPFLGFGVLLSGTATMLNILFPVLATEYAGLTEAQAGIMYAATTIAIILTGPIFGWLSDNVSQKLVLAIRGITNILSSLIYFLFPSFSGFTAGLIIDDMGKTAFRSAWGSLMAHLAQRDVKKRVRTMGYMGTSENAGEIIGPLLAGLLWNMYGVAVLLLTRVLLSVVVEIYTIFLFRYMNKYQSDKARK
ncbi:hypothetical protein PN36_21800 [Candidatus Thiomargarita nelsonii]|uniref:Major facilitator superfamily (MFS) profile domain-containing protein n=1 Tax=Candidatus Thiomargarita nelsonii TaxID=1003181 RepID=A0A4E0QPB7_9GAMM|nr:hypothetical protein PN36_21800 [Candidatus Thiomargarita nelsonii]